MGSGGMGESWVIAELLPSPLGEKVKSFPQSHPFRGKWK